MRKSSKRRSRSPGTLFFARELLVAFQPDTAMEKIGDFWID